MENDIFFQYFEEISNNTNDIKGPDFGPDNLDLFNHSQQAFHAGLAGTESLYNKIDDEDASVSKEKGTYSYNTGDKSVFYY